MRGRRDSQVDMLAFIDPETRVPAATHCVPSNLLRTVLWQRCRRSSTGCTPQWAGPPSRRSDC